MRKKVLAEKSVKQGLNQFQFVEQMKTAAGQMVSGCYFRHVGANVVIL